MTAVKSGLMIIDQYRASVRILYERYLNQSADRPMPSQRVLFPEVIQFSPAELVLLTDLLPQFTKIGFELTDLGGGSYAVNAIPADVDGDPVSLVRTIMAEATEQGASASAAIAPDRVPGGLAAGVVETMALGLARATAVPYGQILSNDEMDNLTNELFACSNVNYTPDGRAILCILPQSDIEQLLA